LARELRMRIDRHAAPVVDDGQPVADVERDLDARRMAGDGFVHAVVDDLGGEMVERALVGAADIHAGAAADGFESLKHLDLRSVVAVGGGARGVEQIVTHKMAIRGGEGRWQARFCAALAHLAAGSVHRISATARNFGGCRRVGPATAKSPKSGVITMKFAALLAVSAASLLAVPAIAQDNRDASQDFNGPYVSIG